MLIAGGITHGTSSMPRHLRWPLAGMLWTKCATMKPISALKITAVMAKMQDCLHHHPERLALEQEDEVAEADEALHRLVQRREMDRIERRIDHQQRDQQDQRQRHQERDASTCAAAPCASRRRRAGRSSHRRRCNAASTIVLVPCEHSAAKSAPPARRRRPSRCGAGAAVRASRRRSAAQVRMKPSISPSAQASVFSIGSPCMKRTHHLGHGSPACRSAAAIFGGAGGAAIDRIW